MSKPEPQSRAAVSRPPGRGRRDRAERTGFPARRPAIDRGAAAVSLDDDLDGRRGFSCRHSYSAGWNGHYGTRRGFRPCKSQKNLQDGKGQFAVEVVFGNPEPGPVILHRGKDIRWCCNTGMDDYHRPVLQSDVTYGRKGQMPADIVRRDIDLEGKLAQRAEHGTGKNRHLPRFRAETIDDLRFAHAGWHAEQPLRLVDHPQEIRISCLRDRIVETTAIG